MRRCAGGRADPPSTSRASKPRWHAPCNLRFIVNAGSIVASTGGAIRASAGSNRGKNGNASAVPLRGRLRTSRHKVAVPQRQRACVIAVARKPTRSQTRTRKSRGFPPTTTHRRCQGSRSGGHPPRAGGRHPPPDFRRQNQPQGPHRGPPPTPAGGCLPPDPRGVSQIRRMVQAADTAPMSREIAKASASPCLREPHPALTRSVQPVVEQR